MRPRRRSAPCCARPAISSIRIPRSASRSPRRRPAIRPCRWWCSAPRMRPSFPMRSRPPAACGRRCRIGSPISIERPERVTDAAGRSSGGRAPHPVSQSRCTRRSCRMSVEVTRLPSGLVVVTDAMPHLETASLGVWVGVRQPRRAAGRARHLASARAHGVQGHDAAHRAPDRRGDRGGRRRPQCRDQRRDHRLLRARAQGRRAARARRALRHPVRSGLRSRGAAARAERDRAGDRRRRGHARRSRVRSAAGDRVSRPAGRPLDPRHARDRALVRPHAARAPI